MTNLLTRTCKKKNSCKNRLFEINFYGSVLPGNHHSALCMGCEGTMLVYWQHENWGRGQCSYTQYIKLPLSPLPPPPPNKPSAAHVASKQMKNDNNDIIIMTLLLCFTCKCFQLIDTI